VDDSVTKNNDHVRCNRKRGFVFLEVWQVSEISDSKIPPNKKKQKKYNFID
jgi:hypothetical protein